MLVLCNCGRIGFDEGRDGGAIVGDDDAGTGGSGSGSGSDVLATGCASPGYGDDFNEAVPCGKFGTSNVFQGMIATSNGQLTMTMNPNTAASLTCSRTGAAIGPAGVFVEVVQALPGNSQTTLSLISDDGAGWGWSVQHGNLLFSDPDGSRSFSYDATQHRWWRLRPLGSAVLGEVSSDGKTWTTLVTSPNTLPATLNLDFGVFETEPVANPGTAVFGGIDVCP